MVIRTMLALALTLMASAVYAQSSGCAGSPVSAIRGIDGARVLSDGSIVGRAKVNINIDGYGKAYHPDNAAAGALIHLCNAGEVFLPDGTSYHGSVDNPTCVGRFMRDFKKIQDAGWTDPAVGAIRWYGILGQGSAAVPHGGTVVTNAIPVMQTDGSGFFVSPTALADNRVGDPAIQSRYVNPLRIPAAVIPNQSVLRQKGVVLGSFGVAIDPSHCIGVPFVVGDFGPRVGEATPALARSLAGLPITDNVTRANRFAGQVDASRVIWVFFGSGQGATRFDSRDEQDLVRKAQAAFEGWGGKRRLEDCLQ